MNNEVLKMNDNELTRYMFKMLDRISACLRHHYGHDVDIDAPLPSKYDAYINGDNGRAPWVN